MLGENGGVMKTGWMTLPHRTHHCMTLDLRDFAPVLKEADYRNCLSLTRYPSSY